jgi:hypothetical protein
MSRILNKKKLLIMIMAVVILTMQMLLIKVGSIGYCICILLDTVALVEIILNDKVKKIMFKQYEPFTAKSKIRNVDCLIIGEICNPQKVMPAHCNNYVQIKIPDSSLFSCFEILKHTSSIIREQGGRVIFVVNERKKFETFNVFDTYFFHKITINKYGLSSLKKKARLPFLFSPIKSFKLLFASKNKKLRLMECLDEEIAVFCEERAYILEIYRC